jgi:ABC-2 type transport system permease protein
LVRDRRALAMIIAIPVIGIVAFGYAVTFDVQHIRTGILDQAHTGASRSLVASFQASKMFGIVDTSASSEAGLRDEIKRGEISEAIVVPAGCGSPGNSRPVRVLADGSDLFSTQSILRAVGGVLQASLAKQASQAALLPPGLASGAQPKIDILYNPAEELVRDDPGPGQPGDGVYRHAHDRARCGPGAGARHAGPAHRHAGTAI